MLEQTSQVTDSASAFKPAHLMLEAHFAYTVGNHQFAKDALQSALELCKKDGCKSLSLLNKDVISEILNWAFQQGIETEMVAACVKTLNLDLHNSSIEQLKPGEIIKIYTLGQFAIEINNKFVSERLGKSKPLELLNAVIALKGRQVNQDKIMAALWPDAEGDTARRNFDTTLHRLRKLLGHNKALILKDRLLTLNPLYVWVDVWELERLLGQVKNSLMKKDQSPERINHLTSKIFALYRGDYLAA